ncbi:hypothetical protein J4P41_13610 [Gluconobacter sp. NFX36]|uniref:AbiU2 domain-containing protein n=1 Tax=Gluconobacter sp. NFX36 TaxID=2819535 RepID=UPI003CEBEF49
MSPQQLTDQLEKHFNLLQDNMSLCIKYFAMWEIAWRDESLAEKLNDSSAGAGFVTLRSMASDSLLSAVVRMFEPDTKAKQSASLSFCVSNLLNDAVFDLFIDPHLQIGRTDSPEYLEFMSALTDTSPEELKAQSDQGVERRKKEEFDPLKERLQSLFNILRSKDTYDMVQRLHHTRNKMVAHADLDRGFNIDKATQGDLKHAFFLAWEIMTIMRGIITTDYEDKRAIFSAYGTAYCLFADIKKEDSQVKADAHSFAKIKSEEFAITLKSFLKTGEFE